MTTEVKIYGLLNLNSLRGQLSKFIDNNGIPTDDEFVIDLCDLTFAAPVGLVALTNTLNFLLKAKCTLSLLHPKTPTEAIEYLDDCGFFDHFFNEKLYPLREAKQRKTNIPLKVLKYEEYNSWLAGTVFPWMSRCLGFDIQSGWPTFSTVLGEIFNNINDHAGEGGDIASTIMQHFPRKSQVDIAISDFGEGIPSRVRGVLPGIGDDSAAILKAVEENFSTRSSPRNRGAGLDTIIRNTVDFNQGSVHIISGYGQVCFAPKRRDGYATAHPIRYPGTLIRLILRTDTINQAEVYEEDLSW
jgi:anti-sigma regulatory factor (Ser/Thr protein kinase)